MAKLSDILDGLKIGSPEPLPSSGKYGVARLTPIILSIVALGLAFEEASKDGLGWRDAFTLAGPVIQSATAFKYYKDAAAEFMDLDTGEALQIAAAVKSAIGTHLKGDALEVVQAAVRLAPQMIELLQAIGKLRTDDREETAS